MSVVVPPESVAPDSVMFAPTRDMVSASPPAPAVAAALDTALQLAVRPSRERLARCANVAQFARLTLTPALLPCARPSAPRWGCGTAAMTAP